MTEKSGPSQSTIQIWSMLKWSLEIRIYIIFFKMSFKSLYYSSIRLQALPHRPGPAGSCKLRNLTQRANQERSKARLC